MKFSEQSIHPPVGLNSSQSLVTQIIICGNYRLNATSISLKQTLNFYHSQLQSSFHPKVQ